MLKDVKNIKIDKYKYDLPDHRIAKHPLPLRDQSKLLVYKNNEITDSSFSDLSRFLPEESVVIRNNTKVIQARIEFQKETGARIEVFCLEPAIPENYETNLAQNGTCSWYCLVGNAKKWKDGTLSKELEINGDKIIFQARRQGQRNGKELIKFSWSPVKFSLSEILDHFGQTPIPPYLQRSSEPEDKERYQTIYANTDGSVAAPTAGLHITQNTEQLFKEKKICTTELTLHVGAGTFTPVKSENIGKHKMHTEHVQITRDLIHDILNNDKHGITVVGTTSLRSLESLYWLGYLIYIDKIDLCEAIHISQWTAYQEDSQLTRRQALLALLVVMTNRQIEVINFTTSLIIAPGYKIRMADRLITNFHQPGSTLLLLVAAFVGQNWEDIYKHALANSYRFLSYGDSSLLFRKE